ncbi:MAG TPA: hypothetical protein VL137_12550 [Polyangiaceae bacterium]|nr:hypothetical protein [Polyangiaceae bacterium]
MTDANVSFPNADASDSDDVRWALETANTLWSQGDQRGAIRWLSRAAETAAHEENDRRSLHLARAAADLRGKLNLASSLAPVAKSTTSAAERTLTGLTAAESLRAPSEPPPGSQASAVETAPDSSRRPRPGATHFAIRVAVGGGLNNDGSLRVRRLADGEVTKGEEHLALLVSLEPDLDLSLL